MVLWKPQHISKHTNLEIMSTSKVWALFIKECRTNTIMEELELFGMLLPVQLAWRSWKDIETDSFLNEFTFVLNTFPSQNAERISFFVWKKMTENAVKQLQRKVFSLSFSHSFSVLPLTLYVSFVLWRAREFETITRWTSTRTISKNKRIANWDCYPNAIWSVTLKQYTPL